MFRDRRLSRPVPLLSASLVCGACTILSLLRHPLHARPLLASSWMLGTVISCMDPSASPAPFPPLLLAALLAAGAPAAWVRSLLRTHPDETAWRTAPLTPGESPGWRDLSPASPHDFEDVTLVSLCDPRYPERLRNHPAAPPLLFCKGDLSLLAPAPLFAVPAVSTVFSDTLAPILAAMLCQLQAPLLTSATAGSASIAIDAVLRAGGAAVVVLASGFDASSPRLTALQSDLHAATALCCSAALPTTPLTDAGRADRDLLLASLAAPLVLAGDTPLARLAYEFSAPILVPLPRGAHRGAPEHALARALAAAPSDATRRLPGWDLSRTHPAAPSVANAVAISREDFDTMLRVLWWCYKPR